MEICKNNVCIPNSFLLVKDISSEIILGTPFLHKIFPIHRIDKNGIIGTFEEAPIAFQFITEPFTKIINQLKNKYQQISFLKHEVYTLSVDHLLQNPKLQQKIDFIKNQFSLQICSDHPNAFWDRKKHVVTLPYEEDFLEGNIPLRLDLVK